MKEYKKLLLALSVASKVITEKTDAKIIITVKNVTTEKFGKLVRQHLLGQVRLGVTPEISNQEDKVSFGCIDIDLPDMTFSEKYYLALSLKYKLLEDYGLNTLIETSKSKGFHLWVFFSLRQERIFIQKILQDVVNNTTDCKIANGEIEVFPKGEKGNAIFLPCFGMFSDENNLNKSYFAKKKNTFVNGEKMKIINNPLDAIQRTMLQNDSILPTLNNLCKYPRCVRKAFFEWKKGNRHYLSMAIAGVLKKVLNVTEEDAINLIKLIARYNRDEEINDRISALKSTYKSNEVAGCSILQGKNKNIAISNIICTKNCKLVESKSENLKAKVRNLQDIHKGYLLKCAVTDMLLSEIKEKGRIYFSNNCYYLFMKDEKLIIPVTEDSRRLKNYLTKIGINAAEGLYRYVLQELIAYCFDNAKNIDIHRFAYFDRENFVLYLYYTPTSLLKIDENNITEVDNGYNEVLFTELPEFNSFKMVKVDSNKDYFKENYLDNIITLDNSNKNIDYKKLIEIWFYSLFFESIMPTKPLLAFIGEKGSGKTSLIRRMGKILYGEKFNVSPFSPDYKDINTMITNNHLLAIDNLDTPTTNINDTLARVATGQVIKLRDYYTTNKQVDFEVHCYIALTSMKPHFTRDDVADRLICVFLHRFDEFGSEISKMDSTVKNRDEIMSYVLLKLQVMIKKLKKNHHKTFKTKSRMGDFAEFALKIAENDEEQKALLKLFETLAKQQSDFATKEDIIYIILREIVGKQCGKTVRYSSTELYKKFREFAIELGLERNFDKIYSNPKSVTTHLMNIQSNISDDIVIDRHKGHANQYFYTIERLISQDTPISDIERLNNACDKFDEINAKFAEKALDMDKEDNKNGK